MRWKLFWSALWATAVTLTMVSVADAAGQSAARPSEFILIVQIVLLIAVGRGLGEVMQRIGQPSVIGELLAGRDRTVAGPTAPPDGLVFVSPLYPAEWALPIEVTSQDTPIPVATPSL